MRLQAKVNLILLLIITAALVLIAVLNKIFMPPEPISIIISISVLGVLGVSISAVFSRMVVEPLKKFTVVFASLTTEAAKDFNQSVEIKSKDEFGQLALGFNGFIALFRGLINRIRDNIAGLTSSSQRLFDSIQQFNASSQEMSDTVLQISKGATAQAGRIEKASKAMEEMGISISQVAATTNTITISSEQVSMNSQLASDFARQMAESIDKVTNLIADSSIKVQFLGERSEQVDEILETITRIADQTNLLSLNAAIEAARAGESGRGFAVVAEEVRKLSEGSSSSANRIKDLIKKIQSETAQAIIAAEISSKEMIVSKGLVNTVMVALNEVAGVIQRIAGMISAISGVTQQHLQVVKKVAVDIAEVASIAQQSSSATEEASASLQEQTASIEELTSGFQELCQLSTELKDLAVEGRSEKKDGGES